MNNTTLEQEIIHHINGGFAFGIHQASYPQFAEHMASFILSKQKEAAEKAFGEGYSAGHDGLNENDYEARKQQFLSQYNQVK